MQNAISLVSVEDLYKRDANLKKQDVVNLQEWLKHQPHLPQLSEDALLIFLHSCLYSNEATKKCIDNFCTIRTHAPEFFQNRDPNDPKVIVTMDSFCLGPLPNPTSEGYTVMYSRMVNKSLDNYIYDYQIKVFDMVSQIFMRETGFSNGYVMVFDFHGSTIGHFLKTPPLSVKKLVYYVQESLPVRLKQIHFINPPNFMERIIGLLKMFINATVSEMIFVHQTTSVFDHIPKECLPNESGGTLGPVTEIMSQMRSSVEKNADALKNFEKIFKVDESKRPGKPKDSGEIFGIEGTFKKLDLD